MFKRSEQVLAKVDGQWVVATYLGKNGRSHYVEYFNQRLWQMDVVAVSKVRKTGL